MRGSFWGGLPKELWFIRHELRGTLERVLDLAEFVAPDIWVKRPEEGRWSVGECIVHLNLTSQAYLPIIRDAIKDARERGLRGRSVYRFDLAGWFFYLLIKPPVRFRIKTAPSFEPLQVGSQEEVLREFGTSQFELISILSDVQDLAIQKIKIRSPFDSRVHYNLYSAFRLIAVHQQRHLWQAEQVLLRQDTWKKVAAEAFISPRFL